MEGTVGTSLSSVPKHHNQLDIPFFNASQFSAPTRQLSQNSSPENNKRPGIPPSHPNIPHSSPYSQIPVSQLGPQQPVNQNFGVRSSHSRSLSQPSIFSFDCLPPLSPFPYLESSSTPLSDLVSVDVLMEERDVSSQAPSLDSSFTRVNAFRVGESLPRHKGHRRSNSDISVGFSTMIQSSSHLGGHGVLDRSVPASENSRVDKPVQLVKQESDWDRGGNNNVEGVGQRKSEGEVMDDLFSAYMNLDNIDTLNSSGTEDKDLDSRASGTKTNGGDSSDNEVESSINSMHETGLNFSTEKREGVKRSAGGDIAPTAGHFRSVSMDSFMGNLHLGDESPKLPPSQGVRVDQHSPSNSMDGNSTKFSLEFGNGEFSGAELKKIMGNEKLSEIAVADPKRAKRILANRQSAARSKERKTRYISELEHKVQTLQTEATTLSAQLTLLQRDSAGLSSQNNELKFRLQAMEQQAQLKDALNDTLTAEVQHLKLATAELRGKAQPSNCMPQQLSMNHQMFQMQHQQPTQLNIYQLQQHRQAQPPQHNQL